jgi:hypothetical protein
MLRALIAIALHRPGLWLFYGIKAPAPVRRKNKVALVASALVMLGAGLSAPPGWRLTAVLIVWALGHLLWGVYLALAIRVR